MQGKVLQLFITQNDTNKTRISPEKIEVDNDGVIGDKFYAKDSNRLVLITSIYSYELARSQGIMIETGSLGENILIDTNPYHLVAGDKLSIGAIEFEITQNCTLCQGLSSVDKNLPKLLRNDRGIFAKVISKNGTVMVGDKVTLS